MPLVAHVDQVPLALELLLAVPSSGKGAGPEDAAGGVAPVEDREPLARRRMQTAEGSLMRRQQDDANRTQRIILVADRGGDAPTSLVARHLPKGIAEPRT